MSPRKNNPAVQWLSILVSPLSPTDFLLQQASELLARSGQFEPPFDPERAAPQSVKRIEKVSISRDGMLVPTEGGFIIKVNSERPPVRQRFACAHEIGHTFFFDLSGPRPWRPYHSCSSYWAEDDLCYQFAEEMLMPKVILEKAKEMGKTQNKVGGLSAPESVLHTIAQCIETPSISSFRGLLRTFHVSSEALTKRIQRLQLWECIIVVLAASLGEHANNLSGSTSSQSDGLQSIEVRKFPLRKMPFVYKHERYKNIHIRWDSLLAGNSSPYIALACPERTSGSEIKVGKSPHVTKRDKCWWAESRRFGSKDAPKVVSIITPIENT